MNKPEDMMIAMGNMIESRGEDGLAVEFVLASFGHVLDLKDQIKVEHQEDGSLVLRGPGAPEIRTHAMTLAAILKGIYTH